MRAHSKLIVLDVGGLGGPETRAADARLSCSLSCSSPASSTVHGGARRAVTCMDGRWWTCGNAEQRTLNPLGVSSGPARPPCADLPKRSGWDAFVQVSTVEM
jgi:hypothetical protein